MSLKQYAEGCYRLIGRGLSREAIDGLISAARNSPLKRARICIHEDSSAPVQEMFVLLLRDSPKGTYKYQRGSSKFLLEGEMDVEFADGVVVPMSAALPFLRVEADVFHTPRIRSEYVLLYEIHQGPWTPEFTVKKRDIAYEREHALNG